MGSKVAFLIPSLKIGGAERTVSLLANHLPLPTCICLFDSRIEYPVNCQVYVIGDKQGMQGTIKRYANYLSFLKSYRPDVVVSLLNKAHTLNLLIGNKNKKFLWIQNYPSWLFMRHQLFLWMHELKHRLLYRVADGILAPSRGLIEKLANDYGIPNSKLHLVYNPVDVEMVRKMAKEELSEKDENLFGDPTIINVGRLVWQKGQWHLIRIFSEVVKELSKARLIIIGGGPLSEYLRALIKGLELEGKVHIIGPSLNPFKYIARSDIFCFPSLKEGLPLAIIEALACDVPVLSSDCKSGPREILSPSTYHEPETREPQFGEFGILMPVPEGKLLDWRNPLTPVERIWAKTITDLFYCKGEALKMYKAKSSNGVKRFDVKLVTKKFLKVVMEGA